MPSSWYSTGSSVVMILISSFLISLSALYRLVVLPEPVGPGHQHDAVRQFDQLAELGVDVLVHADAAERKLHPVLVEDAHHDAFAVQHRDDREPDVDLSTRNLELDPPVLRQSLLGDVEPGHDFQPADDRGLKTVDLRRHRLQLQHAVDPVADLDAGRLGFNVNVAGAGFAGFAENLIDQPHDRRFLRHLRCFGAVPLELFQNLDAALFFSLGHQPVDRFGPHAQVRLDQLGQLRRRCQHGHYGPAGRGAHRVDGVQIERVAGGHHQRVVFPGNRKDLVLMDQLDRKVFEQRQVDFDFRQIDDLQPQRATQGC